VVLEAEGDSVLLRRAYAPRGQTARADAPFWIASITKSFTAAAVLRLREDGRLSLTDSIGRFFPGAPADKRGITIQQLLTHTSGLGGNYSGTGHGDRKGAVDAILAPPLIHKPGDGYRYGDDDYELLAAIVEVASGRAWEDYVQQRLVAPAGLKNTGFACRPPGALAHVACDWAHKGANGMWASADDLLKWTRALRVEGVIGAAGNGAINRPQIVVRKEAPYDVSYGYGVRVYTLNGSVAEVMHSGSGDDGHTSIVRVLRDGRTVIVLSSAGQHAGTTWSSYVAHLIAPRD
jgi:CubicO group peptidase (beta-lactamase class C family)